MGQYYKHKPKTNNVNLGDFWDNADDWKILIDRREAQYQIPPEIAASSMRPDLCMYSRKVKKCMLVELTAPFEDNIASWKAKKTEKYQDLVTSAKENGWNTVLKTVEVGARGFVNMESMKLFRMLGVSQRKCDGIRREMSKVAIRTSHFIWINRKNVEWKTPVRVTQ